MHTEGHQPTRSNRPHVSDAATPIHSQEVADTKATLAAPSGEASHIISEPQTTQFAFERYTGGTPPSLETGQQVIDLFVTVYGGIHGRETLSSPEAYCEEVRRSEMIPFIARDPSGKVVAHTGIISLGYRAVELGYMLADPAVRRFGLAGTLRHHALEHIDELAQQGVVDVIRADCVTKHTSTQKFAKESHFTVTGILDRMGFDMFESNNDETFVRLEYLKNPAIKEERGVYMPSNMYVMSNNIYQDLGYKRSIKLCPEGEALETPVGPAEIKRETYELAAWGALKLELSPGVTAFQMAQEINKEFSGGVRHLAIRVNISHPAAIDQINALRALGFYFAALEPVRECDYLLMQRRSTEDGTLCAPGEVGLYDESARVLVNLIRASQLS